MQLIESQLTSDEIEGFKEKLGSYTKLTIDVKNSWVIAGVKLHADGEKVLLGKGSNQNDIWGGGINFVDKQIDTTAVLNIRPRLNNDSMEILDPGIRNKFIEIVRTYFAQLWK